MDRIFLCGRRKNGDPMCFDVAKDLKVLCFKKSINLNFELLCVCIFLNSFFGLLIKSIFKAHIFRV
jgi:hypothetical protein